jgi:hypothetical protein
MNRGFLILAFTATFALLFIGCSNDPNIVGLGVLPPQDSLQVVSYEAFASSDTTILSRVAGGSSTLLLGTFQSLETRTLLGFSGLSAIPQTAVVDSARLTFRINYRFKDSSGTVGIEAHRFSRAFSGSTFTWDTAAASGAYSDTVSGSLLQTISPQDSIISMKIDTALIRQWTFTNLGYLILLPTGNMVVGISPLNNTAGDARPELKIYYNGNDSTPSSFRMSSGVFVANGTVPQINGSITLQSGIAYRGILRFDSLSIPKRVSVTQAILEIGADTSASLMNSYSDDNVIAFLLRKNITPYDSLALGTKCAPGHTGTQKVYRADVKAIVQQWLLREPNYGLLIRASGELSTFDRFVLYGSSAPSALRPKLTITYTVIP